MVVVETSLVEMEVVETSQVEMEVVETSQVEMEVVETSLVEMVVVETSLVEMVVVETSLVEMEVGETKRQDHPRRLPTPRQFQFSESLVTVRSSSEYTEDCVESVKYLDVGLISVFNTDCVESPLQPLEK